MKAFLTWDRFSVERTLGEHIKEIQADTPTNIAAVSSRDQVSYVLPGHSVSIRGFLQAVRWLLAHNLLVQLHLYLYLTPGMESTEAKATEANFPSSTVARLSALWTKYTSVHVQN